MRNGGTLFINENQIITKLPDQDTLSYFLINSFLSFFLSLSLSSSHNDNKKPNSIKHSLIFRLSCQL